MRTIIFSDVHSNLVALEAAHRRMQKLSPDDYVCLGDVVGYGANPNECCDLVRELVSACVIGNHDAAVSGRMDFNYYYDAARTALSHHARIVSDDNRKWLADLPYTVDYGEDALLCHGSPIEPEKFDYVLHTDQAEQARLSWEKLKDVTFMGHSHLTVCFELPPPDSDAPVREFEPERFTMRRNHKYIVTVGSIGQPRDHDARSCFVTWDQKQRTIAFERLDYDIPEAARRIFEDDKLSVDFGKRLFLGV